MIVPRRRAYWIWVFSAGLKSLLQLKSARLRLRNLQQGRQSWNGCVMISLKQLMGTCSKTTPIVIPMSSVSWRPSPSKFEDASRHKNLTTLTTFTVSVVAPCEQKRLRSSMFLGKPPLICPKRPYCPYGLCGGAMRAKAIGISNFQGSPRLPVHRNWSPHS